MNLNDLIEIDELCIRYKVEHTFIRSLSESGLIEVISLEQKEYVHCDKITEFEKMHRLYHDLNINMEGLEAIQHLLNKLKELQKTNLKLQNRLNIYE
ncbi:MAG: MerR family transcriptional regulator [Flavobacteriaceae bacterium]|nr:MerR family transcriptional regulator [Flavobacteriaceae bacterium]